MIPPPGPLTLVRDILIPGGLRHTTQATWALPILRPRLDVYWTNEALDDAQALDWARHLLTHVYGSALDVRSWSPLTTGLGYCASGTFTTCCVQAETTSGYSYEFPFDSVRHAEAFLDAVDTRALLKLPLDTEFDVPDDEDPDEAPISYLPVAAVKRFVLERRVVSLLGLSPVHHAIALERTLHPTSRSVCARCSCGGYVSMWRTTETHALRDAAEHTGAVEALRL